MEFTIYICASIPDPLIVIGDAAAVECQRQKCLNHYEPPQRGCDTEFYNNGSFLFKIAILEH